MKITIDKRAHASYIYVQNKEDIKKPLKTKDIGGVYVDYDKDGELFGIEVLDTPSKVLDITDNIAGEELKLLNKQDIFNAIYPYVDHDHTALVILRELGYNIEKGDEEVLQKGFIEFIG